MLWISAHVEQDLLIDLFAVPHLENVDAAQVCWNQSVPHLFNQITGWPYNEELQPECLYNRIATVIVEVASERQFYQPFILCREGDVN